MTPKNRFFYNPITGKVFFSRSNEGDTDANAATVLVPIPENGAADKLIDEIAERLTKLELSVFRKIHNKK